MAKRSKRASSKRGGRRVSPGVVADTIIKSMGKELPRFDKDTARVRYSIARSGDLIKSVTFPVVDSTRDRVPALHATLEKLII